MLWGFASLFWYRPAERPIHLPRVPYPEMICRAQLNLVKKKIYGGQSE
jgi:hypothetical protein